ncbi:MAG: lipid II:glycine glycyltransferase FemX [Spirochaeta sp.]
MDAIHIDFTDETAYAGAVLSLQQQRKLEDSRMHLPLLQSSWWGRFKSCFGWNPLYCLVDGMPLLILRREIILGRELWYIPWGPGWLQGDPQITDFQAAGTRTRSIAQAVIRHASREHIRPLPVYLRLDLPFGLHDFQSDESYEGGKTVDDGPVDPARMHIPGFVHPGIQIQVPATVLLDLTQSFDDIVGGMKKKTRYNMRLAEKKGVQIRTAGIDELDRWYDMYLETAERDGIAIHSREYYQSFLRLAAENETAGRDAPIAELLFAEHEGDLLAGIVVAYYDGVGTYMYGASTSHKRNLMPAYLLQGEAIQRARRAGCHTYDFLGIPDTDDPSHPMHGLYRFKTGFGGRIIRRAGIVDLPCKPVAYFGYRAAESLRDWYFHSFRKR